jgi:3-hydroxyisobutyrate dehydrogenase-like beta-hydroxyacid dehydrogenase
MTTIAFIGIGNMGGHMVRHLINAGHQVVVYARRIEATLPYVALGATAAATPALAVKNAEFIFTNVTSTSDVEAVLLGEAGVIHAAQPNTIVCDFSTIDANATRAMAATLASAQIHFLDCPVSGGVKAAEAGTLSIMVGGAADVLERTRPLLALFSSHIFHMGEIGAGQVTKACNQIVQVIAIQGIAEAIHYANANGADAAKVVEALMAGFAGSKMLGLMGPKMAARDFQAGIKAKLHHKDFDLVIKANQQREIPLPMPALTIVHAQLTKLMNEGYGEMDTCNLLRVLENATKNK